MTLLVLLGVHFVCISGTIDIGDLRSGQFLHLSMISQWRVIEIRPNRTTRIRNAQFFQDHAIIVHYLLTIHMQFLIVDPSKGHLRSPGITNGFLPITGDRKEHGDLGIISLFCLVETSIHMQIDLLNPRRHRPFRILPRHKGGGGGTTPLAVSPLIDLELRRKNEHVARRETKRLIYKLKVLGQPVTSEVRSSVEK